MIFAVFDNSFQVLRKFNLILFILFIILKKIQAIFEEIKQLQPIIRDGIMIAGESTLIHDIFVSWLREFEVI